jgi:hypothetical protein
MGMSPSTNVAIDNTLNSVGGIDIDSIQVVSGFVLHVLYTIHYPTIVQSKHSHMEFRTYQLFADSTQSCET